MANKQEDGGPITGLQLKILRVLWRLENASVSEVRHALAKRKLAPTTVATLLKRLESRGLVGHTKEGRQFLFHAQVTELEVAERSVAEVHDTVFQGDVGAFAAQLLARKDVNVEDLARIRKMISARERELKKGT